MPSRRSNPAICGGIGGTACHSSAHQCKDSARCDGVEGDLRRHRTRQLGVGIAWWVVRALIDGLAGRIFVSARA